MNRLCLVALALCTAGAGMNAAAAGMEKPVRVAAAETGFPNYSREEETKSCLFGYGTENSSILDCVARDEKVRGALSKSWPDIDERFRTDCVSRLAKRHLNSYFYLDRCLQSRKKEAATAD